MITLPYVPRVIIYREEDCWIAHCLEMDLVADGRSPFKAIQHLRRMIDTYIEAILEAGNLESLFRRAPSDIFALFMASADYHCVVVPSKNILSFDIRITTGD